MPPDSLFQELILLGINEKIEINNGGSAFEMTEHFLSNLEKPF